ncbi:MAG TPA: tetratricopeptide repeat protein [Spirochaetales bacterium]|nr:tetratricopeptide repeat protein [Spirochaetales bacterium]
MNKFYASWCERMGLNAYVAGDYKKAENWFRKLEQSEPDSIRVLRNLGVVLLAQGKGEEAEHYLLREEQLYGASFDRHAALADLAYSIGKREQAAARYRSALGEPECTEGGKAYHRRAFLEERLALCQDPVAFAETRKAMELFQRAERLREEGNYEAAAADFLKSFYSDRTNWPALNNAASIYLNQLDSPAKAEPLFRKAFELSGSTQVARNMELCEQARARRSKDGNKDK